jgi:hypothetical protein
MASGDHTGHQLALYSSLGQCGTYRSYRKVSPLRQWLGLTAPQSTLTQSEFITVVLTGAMLVVFLIHTLLASSNCQNY